MMVYNPVVKVNQGKLQGEERVTTIGTKFYSFKGIPYAEPPFGSLRFKAPVPIKAWNDIKYATEEKDKAVQQDFLTSDEIIGSEDCLYLNVHTPSLPETLGNGVHPVMVFIHGGGFNIGSGNENDFSSEFFIDKETILVTMNYRLGAIGFLCLDIPEVPGNAGLKDQTLALKFIKENIRFFNGDDNNITIFGASAGSASVEYHIISSMSENLYHKAILQSGCVLNPWSRNRKPKRYVNIITKALGIDDENPKTLLDSLQNVEVNELIKTAILVRDDESLKEGAVCGFGPVVEKKFENTEGFLTSEPIDLLKEGKFSKVPTIFGICRNEGYFMSLLFGKSHVEKLKNHDYADYLTLFKVQDQNSSVDQLKSIYKSKNLDEERQLQDFFSDFLFNSGISQSLKYHGKYCEQTYGYIFSYVGGLKFNVPNMDMVLKDVPHGGDVIYLTKCPKIVSEEAATPRDILMRNQMVELWTNFAKYGNPTVNDSKISIEWTSITDEELCVLNINNEFQMIPFPWPERMKIWESFYS